MKNHNQRLFETLHNVTGFTALQSDMDEIISAVELDKANALKTSIADVLIRLVALPFFGVVTLVFAIRLWVMTLYGFLIYGGEPVVYNKMLNRKTLTDIFFLIKNQQNERKQNTNNTRN